MATVSFNLQQPCKPGKGKKVHELRKQNKSYGHLLNPKETRVYLFLTIDRGNVIKIKTDEKMLPADWDFSKQRAKNSYPDKVNFDARLDEVKNLVLASYRTLQAKQTGINEMREVLKQTVRAKMLPVLDANKNKSIFDAMDDYIDIRLRARNERTRKVFRTVKRSLLEYQEAHGKIDFKGINSVFYSRYVNYLLFERDNYITGKKGMLNDTIEKYLKNLKEFLKWSFEAGYHENMFFKNSQFKISIAKADAETEKSNIITLGEGELQLLHNVDLSHKPHLDRVRDIMLFLIHTGQRWGDVHTFDKNDVQGRVWVFISQKTRQKIRVPFVGFSAPAYDVLQKYDFDLPKISDVKFNKHIKEVGKLAGIDAPTTKTRYMGQKKVVDARPKYKFLSSHLGRRTCVTMLLESGVPPTTVMRLTGHRSLQTLQKYDNTGNDAVVKALTGVNIPLKPQMKIAK